ncbi:MAG: GAF domain-containing protein [Chloroflexi bacterium]|nr:GAF domain-containing protein [Chloroflexota bacterium]
MERADAEKGFDGRSLATDRRQERGPIRTFIAAVLLAGVGLGAKALFMEVAASDPSYLLFFPVVALSAWYGGTWPGILTTLLCGAGEAAVFQAAIGNAGLVEPAAQLRLALFGVAGAIVSVLTGLLRVARTGAEAAREELRERIKGQEHARRTAESVAARLDAVHSVASALAGAVSAEDVGNAVLDAAHRTVGMHAGAVAVASAAGDALLTITTIGYRPDVLESTRRLPLDMPVPIAEAARSRRPLWFETEQQLRSRYPILSTFPNYRFDGSMAVLPLTLEDRLVGAMWFRFAEARSFTPDDRTFMVAIAQQCAQALDRARLFEAERIARTEAEAAERQLALRSGVSEVLGSSPYYERNLERAARLVVAEIPAWCAVDLVDETGSLREVVLVHADPAREAFARGLRARMPVDLDGPSPIARVLATGTSRLIPELDLETIATRATTPETLDAARAIVGRSLMLAPLMSGERPYGVVSLLSSEPGHRFGERDLALLEDVARRVGSAVETSRLYRQLDQFKGTVDASLDAIFMFHPRTLRFAYVNEGAVAQLGYSRERLLGMRALDIEPNFDEDGYRDLIGSLSGGAQTSHTFTTVHRRIDGREIPVEIFLQAVRLPEGEAVMVASARDISERIEAQARLYRLARSERSRAAELNAVLQAMGEAILVCDSQGQVLLANQAAERLFGDLPVDYQQLGTRLGGAVLPPLGVEGGPLEVHLIHEDQRWIELTTYPVVLEASAGTQRAGAASSVATIMVMRDVTEVREAQALREAFLGVLSHELRTPITTIYGTTKVLIRPNSTLDEGTRAELIADIGAEADRLYRIVEDLVVLSRAETGIELEGAPLLLRHLLPSVVASERQRWPATRFGIEVPERLPTARGDATYVEQVLRNLLGNAAKYGPTPGSVTVAVEANDEEVIVRVLDRGVGIQSEEATHLFDLFYRSPATASRARGAGIGLWVCRRLVEGMGGRIWANPRHGGGSEFGFSLRLFTETDIG